MSFIKHNTIHFRMEQSSQVVKSKDSILKSYDYLGKYSIKFKKLIAGYPASSITM